MVAAVFVFDVVVTAVAVTAVVFRFAVVVILCAAAELAVAVSAAEVFVIGALVHDVAVAVVAAGPQALLRAFARGHCFVVD